jgi:hypothetical protein
MKERTMHPNGTCHCGCGAKVPSRSMFVGGHDAKLLSKVIKKEYGGIAEFAAAHGYPKQEDPVV